jgi:hypothetical protein
VPVAYNCSFVPAARVGGAIGVVEPSVPVSVTPVSVFPVTVTTVEPVIPERLALMVGSPAETAVIIPPLTVAPAPFEDQVAVVVMSAVLPSLYLPVAYNCRFVPAAMVGGETGVVDPRVPVSVMPVSGFVAAVTVRGAVAVMVLPFDSVTVAVIVIAVLLAVTPVTTPVLLTTVATPVLDEVQTAASVTFPVVPFE